MGLVLVNPSRASKLIRGLKPLFAKNGLTLVAVNGKAFAANLAMQSHYT